MKLLKGLIWCECGKKYVHKLDHRTSIYLCSRRNNYGVKFCSSQSIREQELLDIIDRHCVIHHKSYENIQTLIDKITVGLDGSINVVYQDGKKSIVNERGIIY